MFRPEDENQALVETPYGQGRVIRTRKAPTNTDLPTTHEIELLNWTRHDDTPGSSFKPAMLYSSNVFPSIQATVGCDVTTMFGRGRVDEIRDDGKLIVTLSSWRLAGRSQVICSLSPKSVQVVMNKKVYDMTMFEKVEHAERLKEKANGLFSGKKYSEALNLYAESVDAVRYVQHQKDSTNELRADLLVVMITCCNNAATCCLYLKDWVRAQKFGQNALVLLEALHEKRKDSRILKLLDREGTSDSKLFGAWMAKSHRAIARGLAERGNTEEAINQLRKAQECLSSYKKEGDVMFQQLQTQQKEILKLLFTCKERLKVERKKERQRALAMFGSAEEKKENENREDSRFEAPQTKPHEIPSQTQPDRDDTGLPRREESTIEGPPLLNVKKRVSFADGSSPGDGVPEEVDAESESTFFEEHKEALFVLGGIILSSMAINFFLGRRRR